MPHIELEIALDLSHTCPDQARAWLNAQPNCTYQRTTHLYNLYYDTPQHTLKHQKSALRLRYDTQAQHWIQTLKTTQPTHQGLNPRQEWETILPPEATPTPNEHNPTPPNWRFDLFPPEARALLQPIKDQLQPIFHTDFTRDIYHHQPTPNQTYEWALDTGHIHPHTSAQTTTPRHTQTIQELEIELKQGTPDTLKQLANQASQTLHAPIQTKSKAQRGYQLNTPTEP